MEIEVEPVDAFGASVSVVHPNSPGELLAYLLNERGWKRKQPALTRCLQVVAEAQTVVIEHDYYDLDFRSELSLMYAKEFDPPTHQTPRLHFFRDRLCWEQLVSEGATEAGAYLGYLILKPTQIGPVGRTMLRVPENIFGVDGHATVRTAAKEEVSFFGHTLSVEAVPFMEQDNQLLTCAHVTAWMCHYTAVLRGFVPRRPTADFVASTGLSEVRTYPSNGLTHADTVHLLEGLDLPPVLMTIDEFWRGMSKIRDPASRWWLRPRFPRNPTTDELLQEEVSTEICRYLNSGFPCLVTLPGHQVMVCGYVRTPSRLGRSVTSVIIHDDQQGPYLVAPFPTHRSIGMDGQLVMESTTSRKESRWRRSPRRIRKAPDVAGSPDEWDALLFPTPRGIWVSGVEAELSGANQVELALGDFAEAVSEALSSLRNEEEPPSSDLPEVDSGRDLTTQYQIEALQRFTATINDFILLLTTRQLSLRTYATVAADFQIDFAFRCSVEGRAENPDPDLIRAMREVSLPKYIWVVEFILRNIRDEKRRPPVIGEAIVDASATPRHPRPIVIHFPGGVWGQLRLPRSRIGEPTVKIVPVDPNVRYYTGRPSLKHRKGPPARPQFKNAVPGTWHHPY